MTLVQVEKRDGKVEDWDRNKVSNSVASAGVSPEETESVTNLIEIWAQRIAGDGPIASTNIRAKVLELLRVVHPEAAAAFENYKKTV